MMIDAPPGNYIRSIEVSDLFGEYNYFLQPQSLIGDPRVLVLYGQNGSGKTTILKIIRSLLSAEDNAGHRTWLARLPFRRVAVELGGGTLIEATRKDQNAGGYKWSIKKDRIEVASIHIRPRNGRVLAEEWDAVQREKYEGICAQLSGLVPNVAYLDDKRTFIERKRHGNEPRWTHRRLPNGQMARVPLFDDSEDGDPVYESLSAFAHSVRREALLLSNRGSQGAQAIYTSLVDRLSSSVQRAAVLSSQSTSELIGKLDQEQKRSEVLSRYGLVSAVDHGEMLRAIDRAGDHGGELLAAVLEPYVESLSARFDALDVLHQSIDRWITSLGQFLFPKMITFRVGDEVQVLSKSGAPLPVAVLSSGERHLLFLLTQAFLMRTSGGLLLVDEPELSLNVAWQRRLVQAMTDNFGGAPGQLIVASHSLEIAAQFEENVVEMADENVPAG